MDDFFLKGLLLGFSIAAPVGPIGILCIQRSLNRGFWAGFVSGLGAATADTVYGLIAAFGITAVSAILIAQADLLGIGGGLFLCYLGVKTFNSKPATVAMADQSKSLIGAYASTFALTITNPMTILAFTLIFSGMGLASASSTAGTSALMVLGVFIGSSLWWLLLTGGASWLKDRFDAQKMVWINRIAGVVIAVFGLLSLANVVFN